MFVLALVGIALASGWKSEENFELNVEQEENAEANVLLWVVSAIQNVIRWIFRRGEHFDENMFLDVAERQLGRTFQTRQFTRTKVDGGVWIRGHADELVMSAYMHPTKAHSVAIRSGATAKILPEKVEVAPAGAWAVAFGNPQSAHGNEALYRIEE